MSGGSANPTLSKHVEHLDGVLRERHIAKSSLVGLQPQDPYNLPANLLTPIHLCQPEFQTSPTVETFTLECFHQFLYIYITFFLTYPNYHKLESVYPYLELTENPHGFSSNH